MIDSVDDAGSGAPSSAGRRLMRAGVARQHVALHCDVRKRHCRTSSMRASSTRARWSIRSLICSPRTAPELEKERDARVAGALHTLTLLSGVPDIMLPTQRLQLLTMVCTHGAKFESQARLSALFSSLATFYDSYTHPRVSDDDLGAAIDQCLAVAQAADAHWRYRMLASVVLMMYRRDRVGAERARRGALCEQRRRSAAAAVRDRAVGDRVAAAALQATFDDRRRACDAQRR
jgi:hypothetical protein